jgi:hypothetical protein
MSLNKELCGLLVQRILEVGLINTTGLAGPKNPPLLDFFSSVFLVVATSLVVLESNIVYWQIGAFSLSAYLTLITPIALTFFLFVFLILMRQKRTGPKKPAGIAALVPVMAPWLALLAYGLLSLVFAWRLEGLQNVLALAVFVLGSLAFAISKAELVKVFVEVVFPIVGAVVGTVFILTQIVDTETRWGIEFFSPRQFAMVACVTLAAAITSPRRDWLVRVSPYLIFASILFSASRTAGAVALLTLLIGICLRVTSKAGRYWGSAGLFLFTAGTFLAASLTARDVAERLGGGGYEQTNILSDSGRFNAWREFLSMPQSMVDWIFGLGAGASAEFGQRNLPHFPQTLNEYLRFLVDHGILGLSLFAFAIVLFVARSEIWRLTSSTSQRGAGLVIVALALIALSDGAFYSYFVVLPASVVVGNGLRGMASPDDRKQNFA